MYRRLIQDMPIIAAEAAIELDNAYNKRPLKRESLEKLSTALKELSNSSEFSIKYDPGLWSFLSQYKGRIIALEEISEVLNEFSEELLKSTDNEDKIAVFRDRCVKISRLFISYEKNLKNSKFNKSQRIQNF